MRKSEPKKRELKSEGKGFPTEMIPQERTRKGIGFPNDMIPQERDSERIHKAMEP